MLPKNAISSVWIHLLAQPSKEKGSFSALRDLCRLRLRMVETSKGPFLEGIQNTCVCRMQVSCEPYVPIVEKVGDLIQKVKLWEDSPVSGEA